MFNTWSAPQGAHKVIVNTTMSTQCNKRTPTSVQICSRGHAKLQGPVCDAIPCFNGCHPLTPSQHCLVKLLWTIRLFLWSRLRCDICCNLKGVKFGDWAIYVSIVCPLVVLRLATRAWLSLPFIRLSTTASFHLIQRSSLCICTTSPIFALVPVVEPLVPWNSRSEVRYSLFHRCQKCLRSTATRATFLRNSPSPGA